METTDVLRRGVRHHPVAVGAERVNRHVGLKLFDGARVKIWTTPPRASAPYKDAIGPHHLDPARLPAWQPSQAESPVCPMTPSVALMRLPSTRKSVCWIEPAQRQRLAASDGAPGDCDACFAAQSLKHIVGRLHFNLLTREHGCRKPVRQQRATHGASPNNDQLHRLDAGRWVGECGTGGENARCACKMNKTASQQSGSKISHRGGATAGKVSAGFPATSAIILDPVQVCSLVVVVPQSL